MSKKSRLEYRKEQLTRLASYCYGNTSFSLTKEEVAELLPKKYGDYAAVMLWWMAGMIYAKGWIF